jgi:glyoxalase family protein
MIGKPWPIDYQWNATLKAIPRRLLIYTIDTAKYTFIYKPCQCSFMETEQVIQLHHIAAVSSNFNKTIQFYRDFLGLNVIHKYSPLEGPQVCHFYWNKKVDKFITFYHCPGLRCGKRGTGTAHTIGFCVRLSSLFFWINRLQKESISFTQTADPFKQSPVLCFEDPDGLILKLVFIKNAQGGGKQNHRMSSESSIIGVHAIEILSREYFPFANLFLKQLNMTCKKASQNRYRFLTTSHNEDNIDITVDSNKEKGESGCGTIHHLALKINDCGVFKDVYRLILDKKNAIIERSLSNGYDSIYFRESDEILFEFLGKKLLSIEKHQGTFGVLG